MSAFLISALLGVLCGGFLASGVAAQTCDLVPVASRWRIEVNDQGTGVHIWDAGGTPRHVPLRASMLPDVHYLADGRYALVLTQTGWVVRLDLEQAQQVAEVRVGQSVSGAALSHPVDGTGQLLAVANAEPHTLVILNAQLQMVKVLKVFDKGGKLSSGVAAVHTAPARRSFIATLKAVPELWEVSYNPSAPEIGLGLVHDFQYREGQFVPGYLNPLRSGLPSPAQDFVLGVSGHEVLTAHRVSETSSAAVRVQITHLDVRKQIAETLLPGWPEWNRAVRWSVKGQGYVAVPVAGQVPWSVLDANQWVLLESQRPEMLGVPSSRAATPLDAACKR